MLIPETGAGLSNSNSYVSLDEADSYFETHPYYADNWDELTPEEKEAHVISATASLDALVTWRGLIVTYAQALGWPRYGVIDDEGRLIEDNIVPQRVKNATLEMAFHLSKGDPYAAVSSAGIDRLKIDVIELEFSGSIVSTPVPAAALLLVKGLGAYAFGSRVRKVLVG